MFFTRFCTVETGGITLFPAISFLFEMGKRKEKNGNLGDKVQFSVAFQQQIPRVMSRVYTCRSNLALANFNWMS